MAIVKASEWDGNDEKIIQGDDEFDLDNLLLLVEYMGPTMRKSDYLKSCKI